MKASFWYITRVCATLLSLAALISLAALWMYDPQLPSLMRYVAGSGAVAVSPLSFLFQSVGALLFSFFGAGAFIFVLLLMYGAASLLQVPGTRSIERMIGITCALPLVSLLSFLQVMPGVHMRLLTSNMLGYYLAFVSGRLIDPLPLAVLAWGLFVACWFLILGSFRLSQALRFLYWIDQKLGVTATLVRAAHALGAWITYCMPAWLVGKAAESEVDMMAQGAVKEEYATRIEELHATLQTNYISKFAQETSPLLDEETDLTVVDDEPGVYQEELFESPSLDMHQGEGGVLEEISYEMPSEEVVVEEVPEESSFSEEPHKEVFAPYVLPSIELFDYAATQQNSAQTEHLQEQAHTLQEKLKQFGIEGEVVSVTRGPVVTLFEYQPASHVKISRILALEDDLALALKALSLRILAPIPGRSVVGLEVADGQRETVFFSDILRSAAYQETRALLPLIIGKDTLYQDVVVDLTEMPHLLVAGSTGSGKSVALHALLVSLLCKRTPDELRFILIDPKRLEFSRYANIPHLLFPIITDPHKVVPHLAWVVQTMEERYQLMADAGVRNIGEYHALHGIEAMPYIVVVIDELADLMMTAGKEVESLLARIAQMARAAGIHLIVATQRPSVDVITGLIKVNIPSRIACKVISRVDSRTILDVSGAEKLLGKGDMLFLDAKGALRRAHGAYLKDSELDQVVATVKAQRPPQYEQLVLTPQVQPDADEQDTLFDEVVAYVKEMDYISISLLQRQFRIGYNRSARIVDLLEAHGIIAPNDGGKMRKVLR